MIGTLFFLIGLGLTVFACIEIGTSPVLQKKQKTLYIILMALTNWIGIFVYYIFSRRKLMAKKKAALA
ncbi:MAG: hypothetical protein K6C30_01985 [Bacteroidaceae bacterium]|nr:hypothetical protein [Bacteroidaceae bacterium]